MTDSTPAQPIERRLAIVMNGGVSLAVWMGGVAYELDNLRRASSGLAGPAEAPRSDQTAEQASAEQEVFEKWAECVKPCQVTVDVIAGTSAGGLNGVLLGTAIASGTRLDALREVWMKDGQLSRTALLGSQGSAAQSVLAGRFFLEGITNAVTKLNRNPTAEARDVSLTVTATGTRGGPRYVRDRNGTVSGEADHLRRYSFKRTKVTYTYTPDDERSFSDPETINDFAASDDISLAARASASFPVAFEPVPESPTLRDRRSWPTWLTGDQPEFLADGGILDNAPFQPVLQAVAAQPVRSQWKRTLCYVVPSAGESLPPTAESTPTAAADSATAAASAALPPSWLSIVSAAVGMPREVDLRDDIEQLHEVMRAGRTDFDVKRLNVLLGSAYRDPRGSEPLEIAVRLATDGLPLYRQARGATGIHQALDLVLDSRADAYLAPSEAVNSADYAGQREWLPDGFPDPTAGLEPGEPAGSFTTSLPAAYTENWAWGLTATERIVALLVRSLAETGPEYDDLRVELSDISLKIGAVRRKVELAIIGQIPTVVLPPDATPADRIDAAFAALDVTATLGALVRGAVIAYGQARGIPAPKVLLASLCVEVANGIGGLAAESRAKPMFDFMRLGISEPPRCLAQIFAEADRAAFESTGQPLPPANILYGSRLGHFAAFGFEDWRAWDWMWGRLHAAVQVGKLLDLSHDQIDAIAAQIALAEDTSLEALRESIPKVLGMTPAAMIRDMEADGTAMLAVDAVLRLLGSNAGTSPRVPGLGRWIAAAAGREAPADPRRGQRALRWLATPARYIARRELIRWFRTR